PPGQPISPRSGLPSGDDRLDHSHRAVGAPEGDLDAAGVLIQEHVEALAVRFQPLDRLPARYGMELHPDPVWLVGPLFGTLLRGDHGTDRLTDLLAAGDLLLELDDL